MAGHAQQPGQRLGAWPTSLSRVDFFRAPTSPAATAAAVVFKQQRRNSDDTTALNWTGMNHSKAQLGNEMA